MIEEEYRHFHLFYSNFRFIEKEYQKFKYEKYTDYSAYNELLEKNHITQISTFIRKIKIIHLMKYCFIQFL
jgi:hypothetical protein